MLYFDLTNLKWSKRRHFNATTFLHQIHSIYGRVGKRQTVHPDISTPFFTYSSILHFYQFWHVQIEFLKKKGKLLKQIQGRWCGIICGTFSIWRVEFRVYFLRWPIFLRNTLMGDRQYFICFYVACVKIWLGFTWEIQFGNQNFFFILSAKNFTHCCCCQIKIF